MTTRVSRRCRWVGGKQPRHILSRSGSNHPTVIRVDIFPVLAGHCSTRHLIEVIDESFKFYIIYMVLNWNIFDSIHFRDTLYYCSYGINCSPIRFDHNKCEEYEKRFLWRDKLVDHFLLFIYRPTNTHLTSKTSPLAINWTQTTLFNWPESMCNINQHAHTHSRPSDTHNISSQTTRIHSHLDIFPNTTTK